MKNLLVILVALPLLIIELASGGTAQADDSNDLAACQAHCAAVYHACYVATNGDSECSYRAEVCNTECSR